MDENDREPFDNYAVVINDEEQYSIWPTEKPVPVGWRAVGKEGIKQVCLDYINEVWTDMRPLSLRKKMEEWAKNPPPPEVQETVVRRPLVERLCEGEHPVVANCRPERTAKALQERLALGHVYVLFTETHGGTELGVRIEPERTDVSDGDFEQATGLVRFAGMLTLDYVPVRCVATINLSNLEGLAHLERIDERANKPDSEIIGSLKA